MLTVFLLERWDKEKHFTNLYKIAKARGGVRNSDPVRAESNWPAQVEQPASEREFSARTSNAIIDGAESLVHYIY